MDPWRLNPVTKSVVEELWREGQLDLYFLVKS